MRAPQAAELLPLTLADLEPLLAIEQAAYPVPWTRGNFIDSFAAGYLARKLVDARRNWLGYFIAMRGVEEMHLLNLTVAPAWQRQGIGRRLLDAVVEAARADAAATLWLEVRPSNVAALALYRHCGFETVGRRKGYYPTSTGEREDALVLSLNLGSQPDAVD